MWRTKPGCKGMPEKYSLEYRIVVHTGHQISSYSYERGKNPINDLSVVAASLGFTNNGVLDHSIGDKHFCHSLDGAVLFEYKIHKNNNVHFKLRKDFFAKAQY